LKTHLPGFAEAWKMREKIDSLEQRRVIEEFAERRKKIYQLIVLVLALAGAVLFFTLRSGVLTRPAGAVVMLFVFMVALFVNLKIWRCPHCGRHLGKLYIGLKHPRFCPECGIRLLEEQG